MKKRIVFSVIIAVASLVLSVIGLFLAENRVSVNLSFSGEMAYINKYTAFAFPFAVSLFSSFLYGMYGKIFQKSLDENDVKSGIKYLVFSAVGLLLTVWVIVRNI
mgnify:CR=1 FL=1